VSYVEIADKAVQDSLRSVLIFDDEYVDICTCYDQDQKRFVEPTGKLADQVKNSASICNGFLQSNMAYRIVRFDEPKRTEQEEYLNRVMRYIEAADLLVLDWELESSKDRTGVFASKLIQGVASQQLLGWIYLYTHVDDRKLVAERIYAALSGRRVPIARLTSGNLGLRLLKRQLVNEMRSNARNERNPWLGRGLDDLLKTRLDADVLAGWLTMTADEITRLGNTIIKRMRDANLGWSDGLNLFAREVILDELAHGIERPAYGQLICEPEIKSAKEADRTTRAFDIVSGGLTVMVRFKGQKECMRPENLASSISTCICRETESIVATMSLILGNEVRRSLPSIRTRFSADHDKAAIAQLALGQDSETNPTYLLMGRVLDHTTERLRRAYLAEQLIPADIWAEYLRTNPKNLSRLREPGQEHAVALCQEVRTLHEEAVERKFPKSPEDFWDSPNIENMVLDWIRCVLERLDRCAAGEESCFNLEGLIYSGDLTVRQSETWQRMVLAWLLTGKANQPLAILRNHAAQLNNYVDALGEVDPLRLDFGHVVMDEVTGAYYLCITAICDCVRPMDKLPKASGVGKNGDDYYYYSFVRGSKASLTEAFEQLTAEGLSYSFLQKPDGTPVAAKWSKALVGMPIRPNYTSADKQKTLSAMTDRGLVDLIFVQQIRPLFAQQIANRAAAHLARVGVDWALM